MSTEQTAIAVQEPLPGDDGSAPVRLPLEAPATAAEEDAWQAAQARVLLYLNALGIPARRSLELAMEAMRRAHGRVDGGLPGHPVPEAMHALREILEEQPGAVDGLTPGIAPGSLAAAPPLNRGSMVPEHLDRRPWCAVFARISGALHGWCRRRPLREG